MIGMFLSTTWYNLYSTITPRGPLWCVGEVHRYGTNSVEVLIMTFYLNTHPQNTAGTEWKFSTSALEACYLCSHKGYRLYGVKRSVKRMLFLQLLPADQSEHTRKTPGCRVSLSTSVGHSLSVNIEPCSCRRPTICS